VVDDFRPPVEQHPDSRVLIRAPVRLNVREEPLDVGFGVSPEAARLASQVVLAASDRVLPGVNAGAKTGAQRLDRST
jgi:hypothetical protein